MKTLPALVSGQTRVPKGRLAPAFAKQCLGFGQLYYPARTYAGPRKPLGLRMYLSFDVVAAHDWGDLQARLRAKGYELAECGTELVVCTADGECLCETAQIGYPHAVLMDQFGASFPYLATRH
mgnify:CR=1 FL=1